MAPKGIRLTGKYARGVPRPQVWLIGADAGEFKHNMYHPWQLAKAQANFRGEGWDMNFEEYYDLWKDLWHSRGRKPEDMCMTRIDTKSPWSHDNCEIISRREHFKRQGGGRKGKTKGVK